MAGVHGDGIRPIEGIMGDTFRRHVEDPVGVFHIVEYPTGYFAGQSTNPFMRVGLDVSRVHPVSSRVKVPSYGVNGCVWFGLAS